MITVTYVTSTHPNWPQFEKHAMSDVSAPLFVAKIAKVYHDTGEVNCTIVNDHVLNEFRVAIARGVIPHEKIRLVISSAEGEEHGEFNRFGRPNKIGDGWLKKHGVIDPLESLCLAIAERQRLDKLENPDRPRSIVRVRNGKPVEKL